MKTYCLYCKKETENQNPKVVRNRKGRIMMLSKCSVCGKGKSKFIKEQEASGLLSSLGVKTGPLNQIPFFGPLLF